MRSSLLCRGSSRPVASRGRKLRSAPSWRRRPLRNERIKVEDVIATTKVYAVSMVNILGANA